MKESLPIAGMVAVTAMVYWLLMILTYVFGERAAYMRLQPWLAGGIGIVCGIAARILIPQLIAGGGIISAGIAGGTYGFSAYGIGCGLKVFCLSASKRGESGSKKIPKD